MGDNWLQDVLALPFEAIYGTDRIFVLDGERMRGVAVERAGETRAPDGRDRALLRAPSIDGEIEVVVTQLPNALDGLRVHVAE